MKQIMRAIRTVFKSKWQLISLILAICLLIIFVQYIQVKNQKNGYADQEILQKLGNLMVLPDEKPKIIPLADIQLLKTNWPDLYHEAQPGSILVQYQNSSLLFDPTHNKILNIITYGTFNKPKPAQILRISFRYDGNELYRALYLKRQIEENQLNSAYQITEVIPSRVLYKDDVIYVVNNKKKDMAAQFAKAIGNSPVIDKPDPTEDPINADVIVAFRPMP